MTTRKLLKNFILMLLMVATLVPMTKPLAVCAKRRCYSIEYPKGHEHPQNWVDYSNNEVEARILEEQKEAGSKNDFQVNYYTIREMVLNDKYDSEILAKKYQTMDEYFRFYAQFSNSWPFYDMESKQFVYKVGIIDKIWELDDGSVVFTLTDNPEKRFLIMSGYDYFHFRYLTEPGDKVSLLTTTDRVVYEFDNYNLTCGQDVNYLGHMNYRHPENMIIDGYFPSKLYQERIEEKNIPIESWLQLMLEYVDVEAEEYNGYCDYMNVNINYEMIPTVDEYYSMQKVVSMTAEGLNNDLYAYEDMRARETANGFNYDYIDEWLTFTYGKIREINVNSNGEAVFTLWEDPTRWYYMSKYYDPLHLAEITKPGDEVYVIHTLGKIVYGFNNNAIFENNILINTPNFVNEPNCNGISMKEFWARINELPDKERQKYEDLNIPKEN